jgi:hypothetical protein
MLVEGINIMLYVVTRLLARSQIPNHLLLQNNKEQDDAKREIDSSHETSRSSRGLWRRCCVCFCNVFGMMSVNVKCNGVEFLVNCYFILP